MSACLFYHNAQLIKPNTFKHVLSPKKKLGPTHPHICGCLCAFYHQTQLIKPNTFMYGVKLPKRGVHRCCCLTLACGHVLQQFADATLDYLASLCSGKSAAEHVLLDC